MTGLAVHRSSSMTTTPELQWIVAALSTLVRGTVLRVSPRDWSAVLDLAARESVGPALAFAIRTAPAEIVPDHVRARLDRAFAESRSRHLVFSRELARVLRGFGSGGIDVIALKGPVLAETLYPHPALRPFNDLDLLVRPAAVRRADQCLTDLGFRRVPDEHSWTFDVRYDHATLYEAPSGVRVDLHWGLLNDRRFAWAAEESLGLWSRAVSARVAGTETLILSTGDLLLSLAMHLAVHHRFAGLLWEWDLAWLLAREPADLDWPTVLTRAERWRVSRALYFSLLTLDRVFGAGAWTDVLDVLKPRGPRAALVRRSPLGLREGHALVPWLLTDRRADAVGTACRSLFPRADWITARYQDGSTSLARGYARHYRALLTNIGARL